jgi:hypothetical protein
MVSRLRTDLVAAWRGVIGAKGAAIAAVGALAAAPVVAQQVDQQKFAVIRTFLTYIDVAAEDDVQAGRDLDAAAATALKALTANRPPDVIGVTRRNRVVVESLTVSGEAAEVRYTSRRVEPSHPLACGTTSTMPLRRASSWEIVEDNVRHKCTEQPPTSLNASDARLLEAARLAAGAVWLTAKNHLVADARLSPDALRILKTAIDLPPATQFETSTHYVQDNYFVISRLDVQQGVVTFVGTLGPFPKGAALACGSTYTVELREKNDGWVFGDLRVMNC